MATEAIPESGWRHPTFEPRTITAFQSEARNQWDIGDLSGEHEPGPAPANGRAPCPPLVSFVPALGAFGVTDALADPVVQLQRGALPLHVNSDWGQRPEADVLERTAAAAGAFPLSRGSKDAAWLV